MEGYTFRLAKKADRPAIVSFVNKHWDTPHPLVNLPDFFAYYYKGNENALHFALAEQPGGIAALVGYIPASHGPHPDLWASIWVADKTAKGSGLELMEALPHLTGCRTLACNNIRPETQPFYRFLGYTAGRVGHFYRLANQPEYHIAKIANKHILPTEGAAQLTKLPTAQALVESGFIPPENRNPYKDLWYLSRRYFAYPRQTYDVWAARLPGDTAPRALLITRTIIALNKTVLRVADYIGEADFLPQLGSAIDALMVRTNAEYADFYCVGIPAKTMARAGFSERLLSDENILPNYLTPPLIQNTDFYFFTSSPENFTLFKADGDQDRPHTPVK